VKRTVWLGLSLLVVFCGSDPFRQGMEAWNRHDYDAAQRALCKVKEQDVNYDSAQALLERLPDTAVAYWLKQAEIDLRNQMFDVALRDCEKASSFRFDDRDTRRAQTRIRKTASRYWTQKASLLLAEEDFAKALKAAKKALSYSPDDRTALKVKEQILKAQAKAQAEEALADRKEYAAQLQQNLLEQGVDAVVVLKGKTTLKVRYPGADGVTAYRFQSDKKLLRKLERLGFEKLVVTDGKGKRWSVDIE